MTKPYITIDAVSYGDTIRACIIDKSNKDEVNILEIVEVQKKGKNHMQRLGGTLRLLWINRSLPICSFEREWETALEAMKQEVAA